MAHDKHLTDIPSSFYSFHNKGPFRKCIECERDLLKADCGYVIEKAIKNHPEYHVSDVIFDYAVCMDCATRLHNELSKESIQNIQNFFTERLNVQERSRKISEANGDVNKLISYCMISHEEVGKSSEYQIFAHCIGNKINLQNPPYMLSSKVLNELSELLSEKTRDDLNEFFNRHFSPDPSLMEPTLRLVLI